MWRDSVQYPRQSHGNEHLEYAAKCSKLENHIFAILHKPTDSEWHLKLTTPGPILQSYKYLLHVLWRSHYRWRSSGGALVCTGSTKFLNFDKGARVTSSWRCYNPWTNSLKMRDKTRLKMLSYGVFFRVPKAPGVCDVSEMYVTEYGHVSKNISVWRAMTSVFWKLFRRFENRARSKPAARTSLLDPMWKINGHVASVSERRNTKIPPYSSLQ